MSGQKDSGSTGFSESPRAAGPRFSRAVAAPPRYKFDYQASGDGTLAPILTMKITGPGGVVLRDGGLIDTGADSCGFPLWMMKKFGIRKRDCKKETFSSAGGRAKQWIWNGSLRIDVADHHVDVRPAVFSDTPITLLGRQDFMERFKVSFDERDLSFGLDPY